MRIPSTKTWLAVAVTLGVGRARKSQQQSALSFNNDDFTLFGNNPDTLGAPILTLNLNGIPLTANDLSRRFTWTAINGNLEIKQIKIYAWNLTTGEADQIAAEFTKDRSPKNNGDAQLITHDPTIRPRATPSINGVANPTAEPITSLGPSSLPEKPQFKPPIGPHAQKVHLDAFSEPNGGYVVIEDATQLQQWTDIPLFFGAVWPNNMGESYSRAFAVVQGEGEAGELARRDGPRFYYNATPVFVDVVRPTWTPTEISPTGSGTPANFGSDPSSPSTQVDGGGLSTGAIIGIAVACGVLGLLLVIAGIWFLIRRRNKQSGSDHLGGPGRPYGAERSRTEDLMAEKEASAGGSDPSPHSPYSDDGVVLVPSGGHASSYHNGGGHNVVSMGTPVAAPVLPQQIPRLSQPHDHHNLQQAGAYTTYSDRGSIGGIGGGGSPSTHAASIVHSTNEEARAGMGSPTAGRATPHSSLAPQYAHLVEEGMTEDEIRRLEDEERQLDAEIELARRR